MTTESTGVAGMNVEHGDAVGAVVNGPEQVILYDESGRQLTVAVNDLEYWMSRGFARERFDLATLAEDIPLIAAEVGKLFPKLIADVESDGDIDTSDAAQQATALFALNKLRDKCMKAVEILSLRYPVRQSRGIEMVTPEGIETFVDPSQEDAYRAQGYTRLIRE